MSFVFKLWSKSDAIGNIKRWKDRIIWIMGLDDCVDCGLGLGIKFNFGVNRICLRELGAREG